MNFFSKWKDKITQGIGDKIQSVKLDFIDKTSGILGYILFSFIAIFIALSVLLFIGFAIAEGFSDLFGSHAWGYLATAGLFLILVMVLFAFRQKFVDQFAGIFIRMLTQQQDDDDDDETEEEKK